MKELIALAKANPGKLNFAVSGIGGAPQLAGIEFAQRTGVQWTYIPYKGGSDAVAGSRRRARRTCCSTACSPPGRR